MNKELESELQLELQLELNELVKSSDLDELKNSIIIELIKIKSKLEKKSKTEIINLIKPYTKSIQNEINLLEIENNIKFKKLTFFPKNQLIGKINRLIESIKTSNSENNLLLMELEVKNIKTDLYNNSNLKGGYKSSNFSPDVIKSTEILILLKKIKNIINTTNIELINLYFNNIKILLLELNKTNEFISHSITVLVNATDNIKIKINNQNDIEKINIILDQIIKVSKNLQLNFCDKDSTESK